MFAIITYKYYYQRQVDSGGSPITKEEPKKIERIFLTYRETQEFLNVSHETLRQLMKQGLPSHKIRRKRVFLIEDLVRWVKEH